MAISKNKQLKIKGVEEIGIKELDKKMDELRRDIDDTLDKSEINTSVEGKKNTVMNLAWTLGCIKAMNQLTIESKGIGVIVAKRWKTFGVRPADNKECISTKIRYKTVTSDEYTNLKSTSTTEKYIYQNTGNSIDWDDIDDLFENYGGRKDIDG